MYTLFQGVYCKSHAPRVEKFALDENCVGIRSAVAAQQISKCHSFNNQVQIYFKALLLSVVLTCGKHMALFI